MKCEYCNKSIQPGEVTHGIKYGEVDVFHEAFLPAKDSAWTVICGSCGELVYKLIYAKLNKKIINHAIYQTFSQFR